jgi:hypothetical protein
MTGFLAMMRGSSFLNESTEARLTILGSNNERGAFLGRTEPPSDGTGGKDEGDCICIAISVFSY